MNTDISVERRTKMKMNEETINGIVSDLKVIPTRTGTNMVTFVLGGKCCKAFGQMAATLQTLNDDQVEITARRGTYGGKPEYAVVNVQTTVEGRNVTVSDTRIDVDANNPLGLKHPGRHGGNPKDLIQRWIMRFIDGLTEAEWKSWSSKNDCGWPGYPDETPKSRIASATISSDYNHDKHKLEAVLPAIKDRFESRLKEVRSHLRERSASAPPATQTPKTPGNVISVEPSASITAEGSPIPPSQMPPTRAPLPGDDFVRVEGVTFEDPDDQYKSKKAGG
jgi:hypothetical protein